MRYWFFIVRIDDWAYCWLSWWLSKNTSFSHFPFDYLLEINVVWVFGLKRYFGFRFIEQRNQVKDIVAVLFYIYSYIHIYIVTFTFTYTYTVTFIVIVTLTCIVTVTVTFILDCGVFDILDADSSRSSLYLYPREVMSSWFITRFLLQCLYIGLYKRCLPCESLFRSIVSKKKISFIKYANQSACNSWE